MSEEATRPARNVADELRQQAKAHAEAIKARATRDTSLERRAVERDEARNVPQYPRGRSGR